MGIGDWGLGIGDWAQSPSPIPNPHFNYTKQIINKNFKVFYRIIDLVEDNNGADKNNKYLNFEEIVKIICHVKRKLISPLLVNKN